MSDFVNFYAHSIPEADDAEWQRLSDHLLSVGRLAAERGSKFALGQEARIAGQLHDLGKYTDGFQSRLRGGAPVDHSTAGARELINATAHSGKSGSMIMAQLIAHCIAGHHTGLPDSIGDLDKRLLQPFELLALGWKDEIDWSADSIDIPSTFQWQKDSPERLCFQLSILGRMIFSCLVDADFRDTEEFYARAESKTIDRTWPRMADIIDTLIGRYNQYMESKTSKSSETTVNRLRAHILEHVRARAPEIPGIFSLTVPTGGGKTLASLGFALDHARRHGFDRIVYAIPFTSVIDQTASIFRDVLGHDVVLEHHSSIDENSFSGREAHDKIRLAMEDWAAPIVITTNVQLFESLHSNRPSRCRRLHNLSRSIIILDEAQTIPRSVLRPCVAALDELALNYGASVVICTATQPALMRPEFAGGLPWQPHRELAPDPEQLHRDLQRVRIVHAGAKQDACLLDDLAAQNQGLIIVNSRAHALELYRRAKSVGLDGLVHLTTRQIASHRRNILAAVRQALKNGQACRVIATSLVEAGVDIDFPRVWRAEAGLDQIAQAAGRCNREWKRPAEESIVTIFEAPEHKPPHEICLLAEDMRRALTKHNNQLLPIALKEYFGEVYWRMGEDRMDKFGALKAFRASGGNLDFDYRKIGESFRLIESGMVPIIVARDESTQQILGKLRNGYMSPGSAARALQSSIVQVPPRARDRLVAAKHVCYLVSDRQPLGEQFAVLTADSLYEIDVGLVWEDAEYLSLENTLI